MRAMRHFVLAAAAIALVLCSCGKQYKAEGVVKAFLKENVRSGSEPRSLHFRDIDSTRHVNDSLITVLRANAENSGRYKPGVKYEEKQGGDRRTLIIARVEYMLGDSAYSDTYYLDEDMTGVVAVKPN